MAFALSDAHAKVRGPYEPLSPEHLFFHAAQRMAAWQPHMGVAPAAASQALQLDGQCIETSWPYLDMLPEDLTTWAPPAGAMPVFKRETDSLPSKVDDVISRIDAGEAVVLTLLIGERFYLPMDGIISDGPADADVDYHAVLGVGYGRRRAERLVLIRNSWGEEWGLNGHAWVTETYLQLRLYGVARISEKEMLS